MDLFGKADLEYSDDDYEEACSVDGDEDAEHEAEVEAFEILQLAHSFARQAVNHGLEYEELASLKAHHQNEMSVGESPRSTAATETPYSETATDHTLEEKLESQCERIQWNFRPSVGAWLRPAPKAPPLHQPCPQGTAAMEPAPVRTSRREIVRSRRRIIGAVVRLPTEGAFTGEAEPDEEPFSPSPPASPTSPTTFKPRAGSAAGSLRHAKRMAAKQQAHPVPQRLDQDDTASEAENSSKSKKRPSSLARTYKALGVELHNMEEKDGASETSMLRTMQKEPSSGSLWLAAYDARDSWRPSDRAPSASQTTSMSAMMLDLAPSKPALARGGALSPPPSVGGAQSYSAAMQATSAAWSGKATKVCWAPAAPPPQGHSSRARSVGGFRAMKAKEAACLLPALSPAAVPSKPIEWNAGQVRSQRRWAANASPMF